MRCSFLSAFQCDYTIIVAPKKTATNRESNLDNAPLALSNSPQKEADFKRAYNICARLGQAPSKQDDEVHLVAAGDAAYGEGDCVKSARGAGRGGGGPAATPASEKRSCSQPNVNRLLFTDMMYGT